MRKETQELRIAGTTSRCLAIHRGSIELAGKSGDPGERVTVVRCTGKDTKMSDMVSGGESLATARE